ncbi:MAG: hypothetical protein BJ554DRAFT_2871, partial [Olpidium bornovanus]
SAWERCLSFSTVAPQRPGGGRRTLTARATPSFPAPSHLPPAPSRPPTPSPPPRRKRAGAPLSTAPGRRLRVSKTALRSVQLLGPLAPLQPDYESAVSKGPVETGLQLRNLDGLSRRWPLLTLAVRSISRTLFASSQRLQAANRLVSEYKSGKRDPGSVNVEELWKCKTRTSAPVLLKAVCSRCGNVQISLPGTVFDTICGQNVFVSPTQVVDATYHSDTGEKIFLPFRLSAFVPVNLILVAGMLTPNPSVRRGP